MNVVADFENISIETGCPLPTLLRNILSTGTTVYGSNWRERMLNEPPPFISWFDFEWIDAGKSRAEIREWLNPEEQHGKVFLPFAQSGAGDAYCLMPIEGQPPGVALISHDDVTSQMGYRSFDDFVCAQYLETFADAGHLASSFSEQEISQIIKADVASVSQFMDEPTRAYLMAFCAIPLTSRAFRQGPRARAETVPSLISQEQLTVESLKFAAPDAAPFPIAARWETKAFALEASSTANVSEPSLDWRTQALDPKTRFAAIQSYRLEFGGSLKDAKLAIDQYIVQLSES